jgi:DNA-binding NtrC family response regulator
MEDIPLLARHFMELAAKEMNCPRARLTPAGLAMLQNYHWPGNIRELRNVIERAVIMAQGGAAEFDLPITITEPLPVKSSGEESSGTERDFLTEPEMLKRERDNLLVVLEKTGWKIKGADGAAELLGIKPTTLLSRIKKMGLRRSDPAARRMPA